MIKPSSDWLSVSRRPVSLALIGWMAEVKVKPTANADVDFSCKMASLEAVMQTHRPCSVSLRRNRTEAMSQRRFRVLENRGLIFLCLVSMLHCALADGKTLVLLDNLNIRDTHSIFFRSLAGWSNIYSSNHFSSSL